MIPLEMKPVEAGMDRRRDSKGPHKALRRRFENSRAR